MYRPSILNIRRAIITGILFAMPACSGDLPPIQIGRIGESARTADDLLGLLAGDEPEAVQAGKEILLAGGTAADAAVAMGLALAVTLPSRAGIAGGGACIVHDAKSGVTEELDFLPDETAGRTVTPAMARGLYALHARYGRRPWGQIVVPAETLAQFGATVSRPLARDLMQSGKLLLSDSAAFAAFLGPDRRMLALGEKFQQPALAEILAKVRMSETFLSTSFTPRWLPVRPETSRDQDIYALPTDGANVEASGTGFVTADGNGNAVSCVLTMGRPFGSGRMAGGILMASEDIASTPVIASITIDHSRGEARSGTAGIGTHLSLNRWSCPVSLRVGSQNCEIAAADTEHGGYALMVVRDTKM